MRTERADVGALWRVASLFFRFQAELLARQWRIDYREGGAVVSRTTSSGFMT
jgi:hypothetical protein